MTYKPIGWDFPVYQVMPSAASSIAAFPTEPAPVKLTTFTNELIAYATEEIPQTQHTNIAFTPTVISKTNSNKNKTQQHIKLAPGHAQANLYKPMDYPSYSLNELTNKAVIIVPDPPILPEDRASRRYKFTGAAIQPHFKFTANANTEFTLPDVTQETLLKETNVVKAEGREKGNRRQRSRSTTREPQQRPPLLSAVSDPAIITNNSSALLTQLLTTNNRRSSMTAADSLTPAMVKREEAVTTNPPDIINSGGSPLDQSLDSPDSPNSSMAIGCDSTSPNRDRRVGHIHAEQKRRYNIKNGFDMIHSLIPQLNQNPNAKLSKAAMLQKGADYIRQLRSERSQLKEEMEALRQQIECLNASISNCQSMLPATGAPVARRRDSKLQEMFDQYVKRRTLENWRFWIFSLMVKPLLTSYNSFVSSSSLEDLYRSTLLWVEQHCTLVDLRPIVLNSLRYLCTKTDILAHPERLPEEARQAVLSTRSSYH